MWIDQLQLRQRDGVTCGPTVAIVGSALLDADYGTGLADAQWFAEEQRRVHRRLNRVWPRALGTTPVGMAHALSAHSRSRYRWRPVHPHDALADVREAVLSGHPVAMLVGRFIPRHWVLLFAPSGGTGFRCYEPSSGTVGTVEADQIRNAELTGIGFPRAFALVLPNGLVVPLAIRGENPRMGTVSGVEMGDVGDIANPSVQAQQGWHGVAPKK